MDEKLYDVVVAQNGVIASITVWRRVTLERARKLAIREQRGFQGYQVGVVESGKGTVGSIITKKDLKHEKKDL